MVEIILHRSIGLGISYDFYKDKFYVKCLVIQLLCFTIFIDIKNKFKFKFTNLFKN